MNALPKQPPHSIEAEQSVLGGLMLDNRKMDDLADKLCAEDFYRADHQVIYRGIAEMIGKGTACDFVTLSEYFRNAGTLDGCGGIAYLGGLAVDNYSVSNLLHYAAIVRERAVQRRLIAAGAMIAESGYRPEGRDCNTLLAQAAQSIEAIQDRRHSAESASYGDLMPAVVEAIDRGIQMGIGTTLADLDAKTTGMHPGDLVVMAGRPSMGKTTYALQIADDTAEAGEAVQVFSMEMPGPQLLLRALSRKSRVPYHALRSGKLNSEQRDRVHLAQSELRRLPLYVDDSSALTLLELRARAMRQHRRHRLGLIVIDYMQYMRAPSAENRTQEISEISRGLKALAKDMRIPVLALSQLNRSLEARDNKRPRMSDLRESGAIEQDADLILFLYRDEIYYPDSPDRGTAEIIIGKQRNGPLDTIRAAYNGEAFTFANLAPEYHRQTIDQPAPRQRGFGRATVPFNERGASSIDL